MSVMKLVEGATEIGFDPSVGYSEPEELDVSRLESISGKEYSYKIYSKKKWIVPLEFISTADTTQINTWWRDLTTVTFYPDLVDNPATTYSIRIRNATKPLASFGVPYWQDGFRGRLEIREI